MEEDKYFTTRVVATILKGDKYHKEGEEIIVPSYQVNKTINEGLSLPINDNITRQIYHIYPVSLRKLTYKLELTAIETINGGNTSDNNIQYDSIDFTDNDWKNRWC